MDNVQVLLIVVVVSLTLLLVVVGVQVMFVIIDLRRAIKRLNSQTVIMGSVNLDENPIKKSVNPIKIADAIPIKMPFSSQVDF